MKKLQNILLDLSKADIKFNLKTAHLVGIATASYFAYSLYTDLDEYKKACHTLQLKNKDVFMAKFQTYFIESFNAPFSLSVNFDEGFGILYRYMAPQDREELLTRKSYVERKTKDFNLLVPLTLAGMLAHPLIAVTPLICYLCGDYAFKQTLSKRFSETPMSNSDEDIWLHDKGQMAMRVSKLISMGAAWLFLYHILL